MIRATRRDERRDRRHNDFILNAIHTREVHIARINEFIYLKRKKTRLIFFLHEQMMIIEKNLC